MPRAIQAVRPLFPFVVIGSLCGQTAWHLLPTPNAPSGRSGHAMVYDAAHLHTVLFGGKAASAPPTADTWSWNGAAWTLASPPTGPAPRSEHAMAYDSFRQRIVMFGGMDGSLLFGDTWEWDGASWSLASTSGPASRARHAMAYDTARQRVVMFGGAGTSPFADTWEWNGVAWAPMVSINYPSARIEHAMAYDPVRHRVVMCGGEVQASASAETWEWNGTNWYPATALATGRWGHAACWWPSLQRVVVKGGAISVWGTVLALTDTWKWDGATWQQHFVTSTGPASHNFAMTFDGVANRLTFCGGATNTPPYLVETWGLGGTVATSTAFGSGCGTPPLSCTPVTSAPPILGQTARALIVNAPSPLAAITVGWSTQSLGPFTLPLPLSGFGLTGCSLWHSADVLGLPIAPVANGLEFAMVLPPPTPILLARRIYLQAYSYAPGQNPAELTTSNALEWRLGDV